jgi:hypothetical protein
MANPTNAIFAVAAAQALASILPFLAAEHLKKPLANAVSISVQTIYVKFGAIKLSNPKFAAQ